MHTGTLTGHVTGSSRQDLIDQAHEQASNYYGPLTKLAIEITLTNEQTIYVDEASFDGLIATQAVVGYEADYQAHLVDKK